KVKTQIEPEQANVTALKVQDENIRDGKDRQGKDRIRNERDKVRDARQISEQLVRAESRLLSLRNEDHRLRVAKRYIDMLLPTDEFRTLALILGLVVLAVAIKGLFEFWQESLVGSVVNRLLFDLRNRL